MKLLSSCLLFLFSTMAFAQQKGDKKQPKIDTTRILKFKGFQEGHAKVNTDEKQSYKMLVATPKDTSLYIALKEAKRNDSKYRIFNNTPPEKPTPDQKKAQPSK